MKEKTDDKNILLRFFISLGVIAMLLVSTAVTCDKTANVEDPLSLEEEIPDEIIQDQENLNNEPPVSNPSTTDPGANTGENSNVDVPVTCNEIGFTVELAKDSYETAFSFGEFKKDEATGSFNVDLAVKLSGLTHANGFVSNHVWIHPDKNKFAMPFVDTGRMNPTNNSGGSSFSNQIDGSNGVHPPQNYDITFCGFGLASDPSNYIEPKASAGDIGADKFWEGYNPTTLDGERHFLTPEDMKKDSMIIGSTGSVCGDILLFGTIITGEGHAEIGVRGPWDTLNTTKLVPYVDEAYEPNVNETGVYYIRDSATYKYEDAVDGVHLPKVVDNHVHANDTDLLYDEVEKVFDNTGVVMAAFKDILRTDINMGLGENWTVQPKGAGPTGNLQFNFSAADGSGHGGSFPLGASDNGGWQKLFTIKPCDETMKNGFAVAYGHADQTKADEWKSEPALTFNGNAAVVTNLPAATARSVVIRKGGNTDANGGNDHALLMESLVSPDHVEGSSLGFFTVQHQELADMDVNKNAFTTKGTIICRSALALEDEEGNYGNDVVDALVEGTQAKEVVEAYANKLVGYKDGAIADDNKGVGLTCYLGLSALWPEAIDGAPKAVTVHDDQFGSATKTVERQYDVSDKHLGILMVNMPEGTPINNDLLKPIFTQFSNAPAVDTHGEKFRLEAGKEGGKEVLKAMKNAEDSGIGYLHGNVKVTFSKE